jgi:DNA end-binding protein Ku
MLNTLRYQDELLDTKGLELPADGLKAAGVSAKEVALAKRLIDDMTEHWKPGEFKDTYHDDLMARIKQKIKQGQTKEITQPGKDEEEEPRTAQVIDLAALLKQSPAKGGAGKPGAQAGPDARETGVARGGGFSGTTRQRTRSVAKRKRA